MKDQVRQEYPLRLETHFPPVSPLKVIGQKKTDQYLVRLTQSASLASTRGGQDIKKILIKPCAKVRHPVP